MLPDTIPLTDEQFQIFLEKTVATEHGHRILDRLTTQNAAATEPHITEMAEENGTDEDE